MIKRFIDDVQSASQRGKACQTYYVDELKRIAKHFEVSSTGKKQEVCKRILQKLDRAGTYTAPAARKMQTAQKIKSQSGCFSFTVDEIKKRLKRAKATESLSKLKKQELCGLWNKYKLSNPDQCQSEQCKIAPGKATPTPTPTPAAAKDTVIPVPIRPQEFTKLMRDNNYNNNFKYVTKVMNSLPKCTTFIGASSKEYDAAIRQVEQILKDEQAGKYALATVKDSQNQLYLQCVVRDILDLSKHSGHNNEERVQMLTDRIKDYFSIQKFSQGANGKVYWVWLQTKDKKIIKPALGVMKLSLKQGTGELMHELAIGFALNTLKPVLPNFTFMYGGFYCSESQSSSSSMASISCPELKNKNNLTTLIIQQNIPSAKPINKIDLTPKQYEITFNETILQLAHVLRVAQKRLKFQHNDLHDENVLLRQIPKSVFDLKGDKYNIRLHGVTEIPVIIDYGFTVVTVDGMIICDGNKPSSPKWIQDQSCYSDYLVTGFDLYRYFYTCLFYSADKRHSKEWMKVYSRLWNNCMKLYRKNSASSATSLKKIMHEEDFERVFNANKGTDRYAQEFGFSKDTSFFKIDLEAWILDYAKNVEKAVYLD
jgi:hypothetical protein